MERKRAATTVVVALLLDQDVNELKSVKNLMMKIQTRTCVMLVKMLANVDKPCQHRDVGENVGLLLNMSKNDQHFHQHWNANFERASCCATCQHGGQTVPTLLANMFVRFVTCFTKYFQTNAKMNDTYKKDA